MNEKDDEGYNVYYDIDSIPWIVSRYVFDNQNLFKLHLTKKSISSNNII